MPVLQQMIDAGLDPYVVYVREPPIYSVVVLALEGDTDTIVQEIELSVDPRTLDEATRMGLIEVWISVELERSRIRSACAALRIKEFQTRPPKFPRPPAKRRSGTQER